MGLNPIYSTRVMFPSGIFLFLCESVRHIFLTLSKQVTEVDMWEGGQSHVKLVVLVVLNAYLLEAHWTFVSTVKLFLTLRRLARTWRTENDMHIRLLCSILFRIPIFRDYFQLFIFQTELKQPCNINYQMGTVKLSVPTMAPLVFSVITSWTMLTH